MLLTKLEIFEKIQGIYEENGYNFKNNNLTRLSDLKNDLGMDSLDIINFVFDIEDVFNICIEEEKIDKFKNIKHLTDYIYILQEKNNVHEL